MPRPVLACGGDAISSSVVAGIAHLMGSLLKEAEAAEMLCGIHTLSPGMVLTNLLLDNATVQNKQVCHHSVSHSRSWQV